MTTGERKQKRPKRGSQQKQKGEPIYRSSLFRGLFLDAVGVSGDVGQTHGQASDLAASIHLLVDILGEVLGRALPATLRHLDIVASSEAAIGALWWAAHW